MLEGRPLTGEDKQTLMRSLGRKQLTLEMLEPLVSLPNALSDYPLTLSDDGHELVYRYDTQQEHTGIAGMLEELSKAGIQFKDLHTEQSSLEDIFVSLVRENP